MASPVLVGRRRLSRRLLCATGWRPSHGQPVASADLFQTLGDTLLDLVQAVLLLGLGAQPQHPRFGAQHASSPPEVDQTELPRPLDPRLHLRVPLCHRVDVLTELHEVPAGTVGVHRRLGDQHRFPSGRAAASQ
jgi:hypothetical protein